MLSQITALKFKQSFKYAVRQRIKCHYFQLTVRYCKVHQQLLKHGFITTWVELIHELRDIRESPNHGLIFFQLPFTAVLLGLKFVSLGNSTRRVTFSLFSTHLVDESTLETKKEKRKRNYLLENLQINSELRSKSSAVTTANHRRVDSMSANQKRKGLYAYKFSRPRRPLVA